MPKPHHQWHAMACSAILARHPQKGQPCGKKSKEDHGACPSFFRFALIREIEDDARSTMRNDEDPSNTKAGSKLTL